MASITKELDADGRPVYKVRVSGGRGRRATRAWRPQDGWSARTTERELQKFAATLENDLASHDLLTSEEKKEQEKLAALEAAKVKTLRQYADGVYMAAKENSLSENTRSCYRQSLDKHVLPTLGDFMIDEITPAMLTKFFSDMQRSGYTSHKVIKQKGKPDTVIDTKHHYSLSTLMKCYVVLQGIFRTAYLDDAVEKNPMDKVPRPKLRKDDASLDEPEQAYTVAEMQYILQCLNHEPLKWRAFIRLMADTGVRRGEACGLMWSDVNFKDNTITIHRNLQYTPSKGVYLATPKNGKTRTVDIGEDVAAVLRNLRQAQASKAMSKFIFTQDGSREPMHPQTPTRYFQKFGKKYGILDFHPHKLRHTSASIAILNGADVVSVSERLGHSDTAITLRLYAHANEESIRKAGQIVRDAMQKEQAK